MLPTNVNTNPFSAYKASAAAMPSGNEDMVRFGAKRRSTRRKARGAQSSQGASSTQANRPQGPKAEAKPASDPAAPPADSFKRTTAPPQASSTDAALQPKPASNTSSPSPKPASESSSSPPPPKPSSETQATAPKEGWSIFGCAKTAAMFVLGTFIVPAAIAAAPGLAMGASTLLACALPFLANRVNPKFENGKLINKAEVIRTSQKELGRLFKFIATPIRIVPGFLITLVTLPFRLPFLRKLRIPGNKRGVYKLLLKAKQFMAKKAPILFSHPRLQEFAQGLPNTLWGKFKFGMKILSLLMFVAFESKLAKLNGLIRTPIQWFFGLFATQQMVNAVKEVAQDMAKPIQPE